MNTIPLASRRTRAVWLAVAPAFALAQVAAAADHRAEAGATPGTVRLAGVVVEYVAGAMTDHFEDGSVRIFDATTVRLTSPSSEAGRELVFYHSEPAPAFSPWRAQAKRVQFYIDSESLNDRKATLFTGAARGFCVVTPRSPGG